VTKILKVGCTFNEYNTITIDNSFKSDLLSISVDTQFSHNDILLDVTKTDAKKMVKILNSFIRGG
jgi:hypothetical protein